ncbi:MAG: type I-D CRISPR-associated helicase Cas3' [Chloroflexi bacterium]|nr:type I-D CRISPR-associated helicase Cas3' [Chloroflexota bacterium]
MKIHLLPTFSRLIESDIALPAKLKAVLPAGTRLSQHQLDTYWALTGGAYDVIFNSALTGDGKSLSGQLPVLASGMNTPLMAMYPTNELLRDQETHLELTCRRWCVDLEIKSLDSPAIDRLMAEGEYRVRGDALLSAIYNHEVLLTNPDIFHLIMHQFYLYPQDAKDKIFGPLLQKYTQFTFDEFHIFEASQIVSVLNALLLIREISTPVRPHAFLFLSATPDDLMLEYLSRSGLRVQEIRGQYCHGQPADPHNWRPILQAADLYFDTLTVEQWIEQHLEDTLLPFFLEHRPGVKGAIIVNSIASAYRLLNKLQTAFAPYGLRVAPNTGFTSHTLRKESYEADLLIGTSTVDVGVDFQINFLLFESRDAGSLIQRLGRLGRHCAYTRNGRTIPFETYTAYALVPQWVQEALFIGKAGAPPLLHTDDAVDREQLQTAIRCAYPQPASFSRYAQTWGKFQTMHILGGLGAPTVREQYKDIRPNLSQCYRQTFQIRLGEADKQEYLILKKEQKELFDEVISFRGGSYFAIGVIDDNETGANKFKNGDLLQLAPNAQLEKLSEEEFYRAAESHGIPRRFFEQHNPLGFYRHIDWLEQRQEFGFFLDQDISTWSADRFGRALLLNRLQLDTSIPGIHSINKQLSRRSIPALICLDTEPLNLKRQLRLPMLFSLYPLKSRDFRNGCIAFGRQALLLETRLRNTPLNPGGTAFIF